MSEFKEQISAMSFPMTSISNSIQLFGNLNPNSTFNFMQLRWESDFNSIQSHWEFEFKRQFESYWHANRRIVTIYN